jgi:hypothetical protein
LVDVDWGRELRREGEMLANRDGEYIAEQGGTHVVDVVEEALVEAIIITGAAVELKVVELAAGVVTD